MRLARRAAGALVVLGAGVLAYAVPATAASSHDTAASTHQGGTKACVDGTKDENLGASWLHGDATTGVIDVSGAGGAPLCHPVELLLSIYKVPDTWDGKGFDSSAAPQPVLTTASGTLAGSNVLRLSVPVPQCGNLQDDLYYPPEITTVTTKGHGAQLIASDLWSVGGNNGFPMPCGTPTPTPTTPYPTETTPTPSPSETTPTPSPTETTPTPTPTTPSPTPTTETPTPSVTTTAGVLSPPTSPPTTQPVTAPIAVVVPAHPVAAAQLAFTGTSSTIPLLTLGALLLGSGIVLSVVGRRRRA